MVDSSENETAAATAAAESSNTEGDSNKSPSTETPVTEDSTVSETTSEAPSSTTTEAEEESVPLVTPPSTTTDNNTSSTTATSTPRPAPMSFERQPSSTQDAPLLSSSSSTALAFLPSTPTWAKIFLPLFCLGTHALFYYGQTAPMWKLRAYANVTAWANATDFTSKRAFDAAGFAHEIPFVYSEEEDVQTFTYYFAIHHLWEAKGLPSTTLPRLAAVLLIIFSGIWPHLKLIWLNLTWFFGKAPGRTSTLHWLSTLGKWSLADVLVVCVMVGVLHLDWIVEPDAIKAGVVEDMPQLLEIVQSLYTADSLCDTLLKMTCDKQKRVTKISKCKACKTLVSEAFSRPSWTQSTGRAIMDGVETSGGGLATLRVVGMSGIYAFSGAVIISILLSLIIDIFDHRAKLQTKRNAQREIGRQRLERVMRRQQQVEAGGDDSLSEPLLGNTNTGPSPLEVDAGEEIVSSGPRSRVALFSCFFILIGFVTTALVFMGVDLDTMERQVSGAGPMLLHDILGVNWQRDYSLRSLMWTTGAAGSWDYLLMGTFALFIVLGPAIRAVLVNVVTLLDRCNVSVSGLAVLVNFVGAFCSWEVFAIAIVMVQMLMPSITNTIIHNHVCGEISEDGSCLQVEFNILPHPFASIVVGGTLLIIMSWQVVNRATDRGNSSTVTSAPSSSSSPLSSSRVMHANHNYQRLEQQLVGQQTSEDEADGQQQQQHGMEEVVFETNQV